MAYLAGATGLRASRGKLRNKFSSRQSGMNSDWSPRHSAIRSAIVLLSAAIFILSRHDLFLRAESAAGLTAAIDIPFTVFFLFCAVIYLAIQLRHRTRAEMTAITSHVGKLRRTVGQIEQLESRMTRLVGQAKGALLTERLDVWAEAIKQASTMPTQEDSEILEKLRAQLHEIDVTAMRMQLVTADVNETDSSGAGPDLSIFGKNSSDADKLVELARIGRDFEKRAQALEAAIESSNSVLQDAKTVFSGNDGSTANDISSRLSAALEEIGQIKTIVQKAGPDHLRQRLFHGVTLPVLASALLTVLSVDAVIAGGAKAFRAIATLIN